MNDLNVIEKIITSISADGIKRILYPDMEAAFVAVFRDTQSEYGWMKIAPDPRAIKDLENRAIVLSQKTESHLKSDLRYNLLEGMQAGEGSDKIANRLKTVFDTSDVDVSRIARNEVLISSKNGRTEAYEAAGVWGRQWMAAKGDRTCDVCKKLDGQIAKTGEWFKHPETGEDLISDMAHILCRCTSKVVFEDPNK